MRALVVGATAAAALMAVAAIAALPLALGAPHRARSDELERTLERAGASATAAFREQARQELARAERVARAAERDLTVQLDGVELWAGGVRMVPPDAACAEPPSIPAELTTVAHHVVLAARARDAKGVEASVRAWLAYRAHERHGAAVDTLAALEPMEALVGSDLVDPALVRALLIEGVERGASRVPPLLQQALRALPSLCDDLVSARVARLLLSTGVSDARLLATLGAWRALARVPPPSTPGTWARGAALAAEVRPDGSAYVVRNDAPLLAARHALAGEAATAELPAPDDARWTRLDEVELRPVGLAELRAGRARVASAVRATSIATGVLAAGAALLVMIDRRRRRQASRLRRDLIASVAHELRTPLASMRLQADALERWVSDTRAHGTLERLQHDVDVLEGMVENVLCFGRIARGGVILRESAVPVLDVCQQVLERAQLECPGLQTEHDGEALTVRADGELVRLVIANLVRNAWRHNPRPTRRVRVVVERSGDDVLVLVSDNGPGIEPVEQARIFRPFERSLTLARGSGLGLTLSREIAALHGGDVRLADSGPQGTTFVLELPA
ncbi:MAG: HAMP domain-containing histidine kinase [Deltaproteobacteria bacterium]|nr:HAMP domain-containing histidine kinase [Deltaproteobacteria bacterium]